MSEPNSTERVEILRLKLERAKYRAEVMKWVIVAIGAVISFFVIDYGRLRLEKLRLSSDNQLRFIEAYSKATESVEPEVWKRKLDVLQLFATDEHVKAWASNQLRDIKEFAALDALYREALKTSSQLINPMTLKEPERVKTRARFEQLYWADLPFAGESTSVKGAMIAFRDGLLLAEKAPTDSEAWNKMNSLLIDLSETFKSEIKDHGKGLEIGSKSN